MKKTAIVTGGSNNQFPAMAVLAMNIADKCPDIADELIIFHDGISEVEQKKVQQIFPTVFIKYQSPFENVDNFSDTVTKYFSPFVFCKYECFKLLEQYKCVIWTDYDVLIKQNISDLKIKENYNCKFIRRELLAKKFHNSFYYNDECVKELACFDILGDGIGCEIFVLYDSLPNPDHLYVRFLELTKKFSESLYLPEEAVISVVFQQEKIMFDKIDTSMYCVKPECDKIDNYNIKILHAIGQPKFWNGRENSEWNAYYERWLKEYNGIPFENKKTKKKSIIKKIFKCILPYGIVQLIKKIKQKKDKV